MKDSRRHRPGLVLGFHPLYRLRLVHLLFTISLALLALVIEAAFGYPAQLYRIIGHPVTWIGKLIDRLDRSLNKSDESFAVRRAKGVLALIILLAVSGTAATLLQAMTPGGWLGLLPLACLVSSLIAQRSLDQHVVAVAKGLELGLTEGRIAVAMIVGRNPAYLDSSGVARAAIESLAENFSDGIVAPLFWTAAGGLPGGVMYKAANTADSMIGHKNERFAAFGWAAARFDDLINLPASRLAALWLILASLVTPGASAQRAAATVLRDARHHRSPNAGWPEAAMAGALDLKLAGPRIYGEERVEDVYMGDGRREATLDDIKKAIRLYRAACVIQAGVLALILAALVAI
ncbi:cobalamin biosynthesis protein CobD [Methylovirgula sp. 4M-Z18]|nr:cobalamin biosynthesis protein CobD [Methylovirgula sp. 4M-Z18]